jgi:hypothetical protein
MTHLLRRRMHRCVSVMLLFVSTFFWVTPIALAKYRPPPKPSSPKGTGTNTTRGGSCDGSTVGLTPLVPFSHVGQTSVQRPTFIWFVPDRQPYPLQFRLFKANGQPLYRTQLQSQPGIMQFSLPQDQPELTIGQTYRWQVVLVRNPNTPLSNVVATANIEVVKPSVAQQTQLAAAQTSQQRINLYAESGLWYDALAATIEASQNSQNLAPVLELLDSLAASEAQPLKDWSDRLKQIEAILAVSAEQRERQRQSH